MTRKSLLKLLGFTPFLYAMNNLKDLEKITDSFSSTDKMPVLFLGHGSPMNAIEENQFVKGFRDMAIALPKPNAIMCISAHWYTKGTMVTAMEMPRTIHDFGGFPQELYEVQYPAHGNPSLAEQTRELLSPVIVELDHHWGLDHGAWSVIKHLYPLADVPVIQLSIDYTQDAAYHFDLAQRLNSLREKGVLIVGSGNIIHNLGKIDFKNFDKDNYGYDWAIEAREKMNAFILDENFQAMIDYKKQGSAWQLAIPTPDHYLPLIYTLALKEKKDTISLFNDKLLAGSLSMTSVKFG